ncbi:MAG: hypothetical protein PHQ61_01355 [Candidatus Omnitrophica bacterium]|nr:hypothetical protein [Candidatus Omnitrophota bacterium]
MSQFLRDEYLRNLTVTEDALRKIDEDIEEIVRQENQTLKSQFQGQDLNNHLLIRSYIIRFDGKGFRLFDFEKAVKYFQDAKKVERFIFIVDSIASINRIQGKSIELRLDALDVNACTIVVQDDNNTWVDATFCKIRERLSRYKNSNHLVRNRLIPFLIQLFGVMVGFVLSLWIAIKIAPKLAIDNSLAFSFVIAFLLFSNIWTVIFELALRLLNYFWPNISFKSKGSLHWLIKALISTAFVSMFFFLISKLFAYLAEIVKSILKQ